MSDANEVSKIILNEAREAWEFHSQGLGWLKWVAVGRGLQECQHLALTATHSNDMTSFTARMAMADILKRERLDRINKGDRSILLKVMENLPAITAWQATLSTSERIRYNHPQAVWKRYQKATVVPPPDPQAASGGETKATPRGYKAALGDAESKISVLEQRLKTEGSLFNLNSDTPEEIARAIVGNVALSRAERIAREVLKLAKDRKAKAGHAG
jgi:hypothetical protein